MSKMSLLMSNRIKVVAEWAARTGAVDEAVAPGSAVRERPYRRRVKLWTHANASSAAEHFRVGLVINTEGRALPAQSAVKVLIVGLVFGFDLSGFAISDRIYLSDTDGLLETKPGTEAVAVGLVTPSFVDQNGMPGKILFWDSRATWPGVAFGKLPGFLRGRRR